MLVESLRTTVSRLTLAVVMLFLAFNVQAQDSLCAVVKIEIKQELTLERQAFDAEMLIHNELTDIPLENVHVDVYFEDENGQSVLATSDPSNTTALFYIRNAGLENIDNVTGTGTVAPSTTAKANWLIIPAPGSALDLTGSVYFVGATLTYDVAGEEESISVAPDQIVVKPLPRLTLDYFLEREVIADDAFTPIIEASQPFTLGVRVSNNGQAVASNVKIESAQPKIIENNQGLAIGFEIISSYVSDEQRTPSLIVDFGEIEPQQAATGRWQMLTNLSGEFTEFTAEFTHADELGGDLTSLLEATNTHFLLKDVLVEVKGRDTILDFLADDGDAIRVYESDNVDSVVDNQSSSASLSFVQSAGGYDEYLLSFDASAGFSFAKLEDSFGFNGSKVVNHLIRSDGKRVPPSNVWFSQTRNDSNTFDYFLNVFDVNSTGQYTLVLGNKQDVPQAPALQFVPDRNVVVGEQISFLVEASDANGTIPVVTAQNLPSGAFFSLDNTENGLATYIFSWTPMNTGSGSGPEGRYEINYVASDGVLSSNRRAFINVLSNNDSDGDGMDDQWELDNFGTLDRDGTGDFDRDGISDLDEYLLGTNPLAGPGNGPTIPVLVAPIFGGQADTLQPTLTVRNSAVEPAVPLQYEFELYSDEALNFIEVAELVSEQLGQTTSYQIPFNLEENTRYFWRARAFDGVLYSEWVQGEFVVNDTPEAPGSFSANSPADGGDVASLTPELEVANSFDPEGSALIYLFELFSDQDATTPVLASSEITAGESGATSWKVTAPLSDNTLYYWRATATDDEGLSTSTSLYSFFTNIENEPPVGLAIIAPLDGDVVNNNNVDLVISEATDPEFSSVMYEFELDTVNTFDSENILRSDEQTDTVFNANNLQEDTTYFWRVRASDGFSSSEWLSASFTVNAVNSAPPVPTIQNPGNGSWVATVLPLLSANSVVDLDGDSVSYQFELYLDSELTVQAETYLSENATWQIENVLNDNTWYFWRVQAIDEQGAFSEWSETSSVFVNENGIDDEPSFVFEAPLTGVDVDSGSIEIRWSDDDPDSSALIALYFDTDGSSEDGTLIVDNLDEDADGASDIYVWNTAGIENGEYYVYAVIADDLSTTTVYSEALITIANENDNEVPVLTLTSPMQDSSIAAGGSVSIAWLDADADNDALISLYYDTDVSGENGTLIVADLSEDADADSGEFTWNVSNVPAGDYYIYGVISDGINPPVYSYAPGMVSISGSVYEGGPTDNMLDGGDGNDLIDGGEGDDTLNGGAGNDQLIGGEGSDTYIFDSNSGQDTVSTFVDGSTEVPSDQIVFDSSVSSSDVVLSRVGDDLVITLATGGNSVTVVDHFKEWGGIRLAQITEIQFDDVVWDINTIDDAVSSDNSGDDEIYGTTGDDQLNGGAGNDRLEGGNGNDVLIGGTGDDNLEGGKGVDVYVINPNDGDDVINNYDSSISDEQRADVIRFGIGIDPLDVLPTREKTNLILTVQTTGQTITIANNFRDWSGNYLAQIKFVEFADGTVWTMDYIRSLIIRTTEDADIVYGFDDMADFIDGLAGDDTLYGGNADDYLVGGLGNDYLDGDNGDDTLEGGKGVDTLKGDRGADTYIINLGDGMDVINNYDGSVSDEERADVLRFGEGIYADDMVLTREKTNLVMTIVNSDQSVLIANHFRSWSGHYRSQITIVEFDDGTAWNASDIESRLLGATNDSDEILGFEDVDDAIDGMGGDDSIYGAGGDDTLIGSAGNDFLSGDSGDDILNGGIGNDNLDGGEGSDIYIIGYDEGNDSIQNYEPLSIDEESEDIIQMGEGIQPDDVTLYADGGDLRIVIGSTGQVITVSMHFTQWSDHSYRSRMSAIIFADGTRWDDLSVSP